MPTLHPAFVFGDSTVPTASSSSSSTLAAAKKRAREGRSFRHKTRTRQVQRRMSSQALSLEVQKLATGKKLTHFQALSLLHKVMAFSCREEEEDDDGEEEEEEEGKGGGVLAAANPEGVKEEEEEEEEEEAEAESTDHEMEEMEKVGQESTAVTTSQ